MARSLDELLEFLLEEITFGAESGLSFGEIATLVQQFYTPVSPKPVVAGDAEAESHSTSSLNYAVDRLFLSKAWRWLARHPDVSVGKDRQHNAQSLEDVEALYPGHNFLEHVNKTAPDAVELTKDILPQNHDPSGPSLSQTSNHEQNIPRFHVNEDRMSIAICGHLPDSSRVVPSEWALLQTIAASKRDGILQGELVRISGQDKRSVPKRTDALRDKGYIVKKALYIRGNKTSRLFLRRFANEDRSPVTGVPIVTEQLTVRSIARQLFDVLKNNPLIPQDDLVDVLGMSGVGRARVFSQLIRYFGKLGCLKRIKTAFGPSARSKDLKVCIQYLKEPDENDWNPQDPQQVDLNQPLETLSSFHEIQASQIDRIGLETDRNEEIEDDEELEQALAEMNPSNISRAFIPQWNPDRSLANVLLEVARKMGYTGMRNMTVRNIVAGPFIKRTLESLLVKCSNRSLQAQPPHLRHLAILRLHDVQNGLPQYHHYTFDIFAQKVIAGECRWQDVSGGEQFLKELQETGKDIADVPESVAVDSFGFPTRAKPLSLAQEGRVTLSQLIRDAKVKDMQLRSGEPFIKEQPNGEIVIVFHRNTGYPSTSQNLGKRIGRPPKAKVELSINLAPEHNNEAGQQNQLSTEVSQEIHDNDGASENHRGIPKADHQTAKSTPEKRSTGTAGHGQIIKGRPRKFVRGTEKFWRDMFASIVEDKDPNFFRGSGKAGLMEHRGALQIFRQRPTDYDEILLRVMDIGLPLPFKAEDVSQNWINRINKFVNRSEPGLYIAPQGQRPRSRGKKSQLLIFRSSRLKELDFSDRKESWTWQSISSSAAHSIRYHRYYPRYGATPQAVVASLLLPPKAPQPVPSASFTSGPPKGRFHEDAQPENHTPTALNIQSKFSLPEPISNIEIDEADDATESELEAGRPPNRDDNRDKDLTNGIVHTVGESFQFKSPQQTRRRSSQSAVIGTVLSPPARSSRKRKLTKKAAENPERFEQHVSPTEQSLYEISDGTYNGEFPDVSMPVLTSSGNVAAHRRSEVIESASSIDQRSTPVNQPTKDIEEIDPISSCSDNVILDDANKASEEALPGSSQLTMATATHVDQDMKKPVEGPVANDRSATPGPSTELSVCLETESDRNDPKAGSTAGLLDPTSTGAGRHEEVYIHEREANNEKHPHPTSHLPRKRSRDATEDLQFVSTQEGRSQQSPATKRLKTDNGLTEIKRKYVAKLCRILILELAGLCSGIAPNVTWTLRRAMIPRWQEANVKSDQLTVKNVRSAIKVLCDSGKLKQIGFAFRGKNGTMVKMSIIALRGTDSASPAVLDLQKKMQEMEPADYIPPELEAEGTRPPNELNRKRYSKEIDASESQDEDPTGHTLLTPQRKRQLRAKEKPVHNEAAGEANDQQELPGAGNSRSISLSPPPEPINPSRVGFLTLKIPRLKELNLPTVTQRTYQLPQANVKPGTNVLITNHQLTASIPRRFGRVKAARRFRTARFDPDTHKLIWKKPRKFEIPSSLDDIPNIKLSREAATLKCDQDVNWARFEAELDCVAAWEQKWSDFFDEKRTEQPVFLNHSITSSQMTKSTQDVVYEFGALVSFDHSTGNEVETRFPEVMSWPPFVGAMQSKGDLDPRASQRTIQRRRKSTKRNASALQGVDLGEAIDADGDYNGKRRKRRRKGNPGEPPRRALNSTLDDGELDNATTPYKRDRVHQVLRHMTEEEKYEVVVAIVIVRTIAGGIEKFIDWRLVLRLLPNQPEHVIRDAWKTMSNRYRSDVADLTDSMQHRYLEALDNGEVPSVNFDAVHETDWEGIFQWGLSNLDRTIVKKTEELPAARAQLLHRNDYVFNEAKALRDILGYNVPCTIPRKEEVLSGVVFGKRMAARPLSSDTLSVRIQAECEESDIALSRAKSWVLATLLAPQTIDATTIQNKLLTIAPTKKECEALLEKAVSSLQRDKLISRAHILMSIGQDDNTNDGFTRLRKFDVSLKFFEQFDFRRMVTVGMLRRATRYKLETLDAAFAQDLPVTLVKDTVLDDGEMVAILNLFAMGMVHIRPGADVPASRWGLEWQKHGYTTRLVDKKALGFAVVVSVNRRTYRYGDVLAAQRGAPAAAIPRGEIDRPDGMGKIPIWFDITHSFREALWELALAAVLGLVSTRPGINAREIAKTLWYAASVVEVQMVLDWAAKLGLIQRTKSGVGWESCEWWWLGVGVGGGWNTACRG